MLLLGAFARDLLFWHMHGKESRRETMDVDIVVQMKDRDAYNLFRSMLIEKGFTDKDLDFPGLCDTETNVEVDLLPFGDIAKDGVITDWPENDDSWSVVGMQEAYDHALRLAIEVDGNMHVLRFVSVPGLVLLKIVAAYDRPKQRCKRDTYDIGFVIKEYLGIGNKTRLQVFPHNDIMDKYNSDLNRATACLLGREIRTMVSGPTKDYVIRLLAHEIESHSSCPFTKGLQDALSMGKFAESKNIVRAILEGLKWSPYPP